MGISLQEHILPSPASGAPPATPSSLYSSSLCPKEEGPSGVLSPLEDKGLIEAPRPSRGGGEGNREEQLTSVG